MSPVDTVRPRVGDPAPDVAMLDQAGSPVHLSSAWDGQPAALVFLRYFGCPFCQAQVVKIRDERSRFDQMGANVALVGQGTPQDATDFGSRIRPPFPIYVDPDRKAYRAYGLTDARFLQVFGPRVGASFLRLNVGRETRQRGLHGGAFWQMPGTFVVDPSGVVRMAHRNRDIADSPSIDALLDALRTAGAIAD